MINEIHSLLLVLVVAAITVMIRFMPFVIFRKKTPQVVLYLGKMLPFAIMGMLVVYCLKNVSLTEGSHAIPEVIAIALVILLHKWKHNTLLSILLGTLAYMFMIQVIF